MGFFIWTLLYLVNGWDTLHNNYNCHSLNIYCEFCIVSSAVTLTWKHEFVSAQLLYSRTIGAPCSLCLLMWDFTYKKHWMRPAEPNYVGVCKTPFKHLPAISVANTGCVWWASPVHIWHNNFPSDFRQASYRYFTITHKLRPFGHPLTQVKFNYLLW